MLGVCLSKRLTLHMETKIGGHSAGVQAVLQVAVRMCFSPASI
jgi:hypothetical protein